MSRGLGPGRHRGDKKRKHRASHSPWPAPHTDKRGPLSAAFKVTKFSRRYLGCIASVSCVSTAPIDLSPACPTKARPQGPRPSALPRQQAKVALRRAFVADGAFCLMTGEPPPVCSMFLWPFKLPRSSNDASPRTPAGDLGGFCALAQMKTEI